MAGTSLIMNHLLLPVFSTSSSKSCGTWCTCTAVARGAEGWMGSPPYRPEMKTCMKRLVSTTACPRLDVRPIITKHDFTGESSAAMDDNPSNGDGAAGPSSGTQGTVMTELPLRGRATTLSDFDDEVKREPDSDSELPMPPAWLQAWPISLHITLFSSAAAVPTIPSSSDSEPRRKPGNFGSRLFPRNVTTTYMCPTYDDLVWHIRQYHQRTTAKRQRYSRSAGTATTGSDDLVNFTIRARLPGSPPIIHDDHSYWEAVGNVREAEWMDDTLKLAVLVELPPDTLGDSI